MKNVEKKKYETVKFVLTLPNRALLDEWKAEASSLTLDLSSYIRLLVNADIQNRRVKINSDKSIEFMEMMKKLLQQESKKKKNL